MCVLADDSPAPGADPEAVCCVEVCVCVSVSESAWGCDAVVVRACDGQWVSG